jgi:hypothetical protein
MLRKTDQPDIEVGARVKAKKLQRDGGPVRRDVELHWHAEARAVARPAADEVRTTKGRTER